MKGKALPAYRMNHFGLARAADFIGIFTWSNTAEARHTVYWGYVYVTIDEWNYVDDREMFVQVAAEIGFTALQHTDLASTREKFRRLGLAVD